MKVTFAHGTPEYTAIVNQWYAIWVSDGLSGTLRDAELLFRQEHGLSIMFDVVSNSSTVDVEYESEDDLLLFLLKFCEYENGAIEKN